MIFHLFVYSYVKIDCRMLAGLLEAAEVVSCYCCAAKENYQIQRSDE
jgi:hypothetical protein